jgi:hypothetical protein
VLVATLPPLMQNNGREDRSKQREAPLHVSAPVCASLFVSTTTFFNHDPAFCDP